MDTTTSGHLEHLPIEQLRQYGRNPRKGNVPAIKQSLKHHGQFKPLLVNAGAQTGEEWAILAGNHTYAAMQELNREARDAGAPEPYFMVPCYVIDVDEQEAAQIVLVDNKTADMAGYNDEALLDLLQAVDSLEATGFTETEMKDLEAILNQNYIEDEDEPLTNPYDDFIPIRLNLPPVLAQQWLAFSMDFDSGEEALEHLLDHGAEA